jgi:hypothetical protein
MTTVRFVEHDGTVTDVQFRTLRAARYAIKVTGGVRCAFVLYRPRRAQ